MANFMNGLKQATNFGYTDNGAITRKSTGSALYDLFALGGAYRSRTKSDTIVLFSKALAENETYAMKCLFYLRDILEGQGERRFFRWCMEWLANQYPAIARRNLAHIPELGRYDDLYCFVNTKVEADAFAFIKKQLELDVQCKTPSLLAKWLKSENASSAETKHLARVTRHYLGMTSKQYRKTLSILRARINVLERLMSANEWDKIEFDKIPSKAGMIYRNAFARHDVERAQAKKMTYTEFAKSEDTKVNAKALAPYECVHAAIDLRHSLRLGQKEPDETQRAMINKYWANLTDYIQNATFNGICVCDTSGSMTNSYNGTTTCPIDVAISLSLYCAEKAKGPYANHYISFASRPQLIETVGIDFYDKVQRIYRTNLIDNTNIEAVFDLLLNTAINNNCTQEDIPQNVIIISDMEFDMARTSRRFSIGTLMETIENKWIANGYTMPKLVFWNVNARNDNIPMQTKDGVSFVSGFSPVLFEQIMQGKDSIDLMFDKLNKDRYKDIY